jgi:oxazoline/thiazoline synthase
MLQSRNTSTPLTLQKREKEFKADGGHRSSPPEDILQRYAHLVGPSGIIEELKVTHRDPCNLVHVHVAHLRSARASGHRGLWKGLRASCAGKGMTEAQARASALGEAIERYSGIFRGSEVRIKASYRELNNKAIHPNACMNFSIRQFQQREKCNRRDADFNWVPEPFDEDREIEWTPVWSLTEEQFKYVATALCYFGYPYDPQHDFCRPDSNGNAAGACLEEAILQGLLEVVERDAVALWWYNRACRPRVELAGFGEKYFEALEELYRILGREMYVLDISADYPIPVFAAVSREKNGGGNLLLGFGAHLEPRIAIARALTEMNQFLAEAVSGKKLRFFVGEPFDKSFILPDPLATAKTSGDYTRLDTEDLREDVWICVQQARQRGMETLVLDQTRADVGMHVVKVVVPGMRPWWARFASGRLYDSPVAAEWREVRLTEAQLNPCHLVI